MKNTLDKVLHRPGQASFIELDEVENFLSDLNKNLKIYISVYGCEPLGHTLEVQIETIQWYKDRDKGNK